MATRLDEAVAAGEFDHLGRSGRRGQAYQQLFVELDDDDLIELEDEAEFLEDESLDANPSPAILRRAIRIVIYKAFKDAGDGGSYRAIDFLNGYARMLAHDCGAIDEQDIADFVKSIGITPKKGLVCPKCGAHRKS